MGIDETWQYGLAVTINRSGGSPGQRFERGGFRNQGYATVIGGN